MDEFDYPSTMHISALIIDEDTNRATIDHGLDLIMRMDSDKTVFL